MDEQFQKFVSIAVYMDFGDGKKKCFWMQVTWKFSYDISRESW